MLICPPATCCEAMRNHTLQSHLHHLPACSNTYSAVNALAGHFNSYGLTAPVPKKRLDRIQKVGVP